MSRALLKSTALVSAMTFFSRVLGFARDIVFAQFFGAGSGTDAFFVAFRIPNFMRRLFAEGAFSLAFVPVFSEYRENRSEAELRELVDNVAGTLGVILFFVTVSGVLAAPLLVVLFAPGFSDDASQYDLTVSMLRLTFPYLFFISLVAFAGGILNSCGRFAVPAFTPVLLNISMIAAAVWLAPQLANPVTALAWAVFCAGLVQLLFQLPFLRALNLLPRPRWGWNFVGVRRILKLMIPTLFGASVAQVHLLVNTLLASLLVSGSVSWLYYTDRLVEFPLGVIGVAVGTVILPRLSRQHAGASDEHFSRTLDWGLRWVLLMATPATFALVLLSGPLLTTFFQYGAFTAFDVQMAQRSLIAYALGLVGFMLVKVLAPGFYARQDTRTPVKIGITAMAVGMSLSIVLMQLLAHAGLALATALAAYVNAGLLFRTLRRDKVYRPVAGWTGFLTRMLAANLTMALVLWYAAGKLDDWLILGWRERVLDLLFLVFSGAAVYVCALLASGLRLHHLKLQE